MGRIYKKIVNFVTMKTILTSLYLLLVLVLLLPTRLNAQKHEFRGAWIQCVNGQFTGMSTQRMQQYLTWQLDELQKDGVNAVIFQVRPECDALYKSSIEPWSRYLTGRQGQAPDTNWDPLQWMIEQCHSRGMELHAWINPFRAKTKFTTALAPNHIAAQHPERVFNYDGQLILNPGLKENRDYIIKVALDIVNRYDVDGFHIDDYFYPYPVAGQTINDEATYEADRRGFNNIADWRRDNVNIMVKQLGEAIHQAKPWVKFGVSPFGIYRNKRTAPNVGSNTFGLQNYDDLYADVLLWVNNGWIDYCVPQLYWQIGNKAADYATLIEWWNNHAYNRPLYIGEDVERTVKYADLQNPNLNQMPAKHKLHQEMPAVKGTVLWYSKVVADNVGNYGSMLRYNYWKHPALQPRMPFIDSKAPKKPRKLKVINTADGLVLCWTAPKGKHWGDVAQWYAVYRFAKGEKVETSDGQHLVTVTHSPFYLLKTNDRNATLAVSAVDRAGNESKAKKVSIK